MRLPKLTPSMQYYIVSGVLIVGGILLMLLPHVRRHWEWYDAPHTLGDGFFVAGVLSLTVELYIRMRVHQQGGQDIFQFLLGYGLPQQYQDRIREIVVTPKILRCDGRFDYTISPDQSNSKQLRINIVRSFAIENITSSAQTYTHELALSAQEAETKHKRVLRMARYCKTNEKEDYCFKENQLLTNPPDEEGDIVVCVPEHEKETILPAHSKGFRFETEYEMTWDVDKPGCDWFEFVYPTRDVTVSVKHPVDIKVTLSPKPTTPHKVFDSWNYERLFLSGEVLWVRWEKAKQEPTGITDGTTTGKSVAASSRQ